jgi:hypothetical protein
LLIRIKNKLPPFFEPGNLRTTSVYTVYAVEAI